MRAPLTWLCLVWSHITVPVLCPRIVPPAKQMSGSSESGALLQVAHTGHMFVVAPFSFVVEIFLLVATSRLRKTPQRFPDDAHPDLPCHPINCLDCTGSALENFGCCLLLFLPFLRRNVMYLTSKVEQQPVPHSFEVTWLLHTSETIRDWEGRCVIHNSCQILWNPSDVSRHEGRGCRFVVSSFSVILECAFLEGVSEQFWSKQLAKRTFSAASPQKETCELHHVHTNSKEDSKN